MKKFLVFLALIGLGAALYWGIPWAMQKIAFNKATEANTVEAYYQFVTQNKQAPQCAEAPPGLAVGIHGATRPQMSPIPGSGGRALAHTI